MYITMVITYLSTTMIGWLDDFSILGFLPFHNNVMYSTYVCASLGSLGHSCDLLLQLCASTITRSLVVAKSRAVFAALKLAALLQCISSKCLNQGVAQAAS